jgi:ADP-ribosyl-[dinitrogen reductase] hydrolase
MQQRVDERRRDRLRGTLLGLAVGDALGASVEFEPYGTFTPVTGYRAGGPHDLAAGEWTDDTSLALALADSLTSVGWDLDDQAERYLAWFRAGEYSVNGRVFDVGRTTLDALLRFSGTRDARTSGDPSGRASGNGSLMRLAPVAIWYHSLIGDDPVALALRAWDSSLPTHASHQCTSSCAALALMLAGLAHGMPREEVLRMDWPPLRQLASERALHPEVRRVLEGSFRTKEPPDIRGSGYVVESLEAALWSFHTSASFEEAVLRAVNLGDDADTTGAVCGQLAGAYFGETGIPERFIAGLAGLEMVEAALVKLVP